MGFSDYNSNPDLNVSISGVNIGEGCPPSGINNAIRQVMADAKAEDGAVVHNTGAETISGAKTFAGSAIFKSAATISGGITISGAATFKSGATISGGLTVSGGISGNAATATSATSAGVAAKLGTANVGSSNVPIYLNGGVASACSDVMDLTTSQNVTGEKLFTASSRAGVGEIVAPACGIRCKNGQADTLYAGHPVKVIGTASGGTFGYAFGDGGVAMLAGGEAAAEFAGRANIDGSSEQAYVVADQNVTIVTNLNNSGYDNRHTFNFTTGGTLQVDGGSGTVTAATFSGNATTATNASSLGGVSAGGYMRKTANIQRGSASLYTSGTSVNAGAVTSKSVTFGSAFSGTPTVVATVRGGANSYAAGQNVAVQAETSSGCTFVVRNTYSAAITTSAASYIDYIAMYV